MTSQKLGALRPSRRLDGLPGYGRGRAVQSLPYLHRLGSNEAPDAPSASVQAAVATAIAGSNRYPDLRGEALIESLARRHDVSVESIAVSAGSIVLLDQLVRAYCDPGDSIVTPWRSYEAYPIVAGAAGAKLVEVPLDSDHRLDPRAMLDAIDPSCRLVLLCNPNNPTGTALSSAAIDALIEALPVNVLIVLDEAYADYSEDAATVAASPGRRIARHPNLAVLRTFSKAWGLAGMRAGYCVAHPQIIAAVQAVAPPFPLPSVTVAAALATLAEDNAVANRIARNATERARLSEGLASKGLPVADSAANFVWLQVGYEAEAVTAHLRQAGIAVRCFNNEGVRITTGTAQDTNAVLSALDSWQPASSDLSIEQPKGRSRK